MFIHLDICCAPPEHTGIPITCQSPCLIASYIATETSQKLISHSNVTGAITATSDKRWKHSVLIAISTYSSNKRNSNGCAYMHGMGHERELTINLERWRCLLLIPMTAQASLNGNFIEKNYETFVFFIVCHSVLFFLLHKQMYPAVEWNWWSVESGEWAKDCVEAFPIDVCRQCKVPAVSCVRTQNGMYITTGVHHHMQITNCTETWNIQCIFHISCGRIGVGQTCVAGSVRSWPQILGLHSIHSGCCTAQGTHCSIYSDAAAHQFCTQFYA